MIANGCKMTVH